MFTWPFDTNAKCDHIVSVQKCLSSLRRIRNIILCSGILSYFKHEKVRRVCSVWPGIGYLILELCLPLIRLGCPIFIPFCFHANESCSGQWWAIVCKRDPTQCFFRSAQSPFTMDGSRNVRLFSPILNTPRSFSCAIANSKSAEWIERMNFKQNFSEMKPLFVCSLVNQIYWKNHAWFACNLVSFFECQKSI